jgi:hypothetical protein
MFFVCKAEKNQVKPPGFISGEAIKNNRTFALELNQTLIKRTFALSASSQALRPDSPY